MENLARGVEISIVVVVVIGLLAAVVIGAIKSRQGGKLG